LKFDEKDAGICEKLQEYADDPTEGSKAEVWLEDLQMQAEEWKARGKPKSSV